MFPELGHRNYRSPDTSGAGGYPDLSLPNPGSYLPSTTRIANRLVELGMNNPMFNDLMEGYLRRVSDPKSHVTAVSFVYSSAKGSEPSAISVDTLMDIPINDSHSSEAEAATRTLSDHWNPLDREKQLLIPFFTSTDQYPDIASFGKSIIEGDLLEGTVAGVVSTQELRNELTPFEQIQLIAKEGTIQNGNIIIRFDEYGDEAINVYVEERTAGLFNAFKFAFYVSAKEVHGIGLGNSTDGIPIEKEFPKGLSPEGEAAYHKEDVRKIAEFVRAHKNQP